MSPQKSAKPAVTDTDFDVTPEEPEAIAPGPRSSYGDPIRSIFDWASAPRVEIAVSSFKGSRRVHRIDGDSAKATNGRSATGQPGFNKAAAAAKVSDLPPMTDDYLIERIGWHREHMGVNPREQSPVVWLKDKDGSFYSSDKESWAAISIAIGNASGSLKGSAKNLQQYVRAMRVPDVTPERLHQLLVWNHEKTNKPLRKSETVWLKEGEGHNTTWSVAPYRWGDIRREFDYLEIRQRLGAESLEVFIRQRNEAKLMNEIKDNTVVPFWPQRQR